MFSYKLSKREKFCNFFWKPWILSSLFEGPFCLLTNRSTCKNINVVMIIDVCSSQQVSYWEGGNMIVIFLWARKNAKTIHSLLSILFSLNTIFIIKFILPKINTKHRNLFYILSTCFFLIQSFHHFKLCKKI